MESELKERFKAFAKQLPGAEHIDDLAHTKEQAVNCKADFFFDDRRIVCEEKSLQTDTEHKIECILAPFRSTPHFPSFSGRWDLEKVLEHLPDGEQIRNRIYKAITSSIENGVKDANKQIKETKHYFDLPSSSGLLIILNDLVEVLPPDRVMARVSDLLQERTQEGDLKYTEIAAVLIISEVHEVQIGKDLRGTGSLVGTNVNHADSAKIADFAELLQRQWAAYNGRIFIDAGPDVLQHYEFERLTDSSTSLHRQNVVREIDILRERLLAKYGEMHDSTALIREDRESR